MNVNFADPLLTEAETAERLVAKKETLTKWRHRGRGPAFLKLSGKIRYRLSDIEAFIEASRHVPGEPKRRNRVARQATVPTQKRHQSAA